VDQQPSQSAAADRRATATTVDQQPSPGAAVADRRATASKAARLPPSQGNSSIVPAPAAPL